MQINPNFQNNNIHTSILYLNDMHAQYPKVPEMKSEADTFEMSRKDNPDIDSFVLAGGDSFIGKNKNKNKLASSTLNLLKVEYSAMGNHEVDSMDTLPDNLQNTDTTFVTSNVKKSGATPFDKYLENKKIVSSTIVERNGHKYGIIGASPFKLNKSQKLHAANLDVDKYEKTKEDLQKEIKNLQEQGIDKIILVSHIGYANDKKIAQEVSGIDIIVGGHSHDLVEGTKTGQNIITAPDGNPVIITQAGQNCDYIGKLDVTFDKSGNIVEATNKVKSTENSSKNLMVKFFQDRILGKPTPLGTLTVADKPKGNPKICENPYADFLADAMRTELDTDIAMINSANIRGSMKKGPISNLDFQNLIPFENKLAKIEISEKEIINTLKEGAKSVNDKMLKPGIMQTSGINYKITKEGDVIDVNYEDKKGNITPLNWKNPSTDKKFTAVIDDFLLKSDEYPTLNNCKVLEKYNFDKTKIAQDYTEKLDKNNIQIKLKNRIENQGLNP